jgi:hypothetical protein
VVTDYTALGNAIKTTLQNDTWVGNNVQTIEIHKRGFSIQDEKDAQYFSKEDLPAIAVIPNSGAKQQEIQTTNEIRETVPAQIVTVNQMRNAQTGIEENLLIVKNIERILDKQKSSTNNLGIDAFVQSVSTTDEQFKKGEYYYFISTTTAQIEITIPF